MKTFPSPGAMTVDWEERVNPDRLRSYRFGRATAALEASDLGGARFVVVIPGARPGAERGEEAGALAAAPAARIEQGGAP